MHVCRITTQGITSLKRHLPMGKVVGLRLSIDTGSPAHSHRPAGFTLIELLVVMAILTIIIAIGVPPLQNALIVDHVKEAARWIILKEPTLKERAVSEQKIYRLHVDMDTNRFWISDESMDEDQLLDAARQGFELTGDLEVLDVEYPNAETISAGLAEIGFYPQGYSDRAIIHLKDNDARLSFEVEPFLSNVIMVEDYVSY